MSTWRAFLETHKDRVEYDAYADCIQRIINTADSAAASYAHLIDHLSLVCITSSSMDNEIQATFFHTTRKTSLNSLDHVNLALLGFGARACVVQYTVNDPAKLVYV